MMLNLRMSLVKSLSSDYYGITADKVNNRSPLSLLPVSGGN